MFGFFPPVVFLPSRRFEMEKTPQLFIAKRYSRILGSWETIQSTFSLAAAIAIARQHRLPLVHDSTWTKVFDSEGVCRYNSLDD